MHMSTIRQQEKEGLKEYFARFNNEDLRVEGYTDSATQVVVVARLRDARLLRSIGKKELTSYMEFITRAQKYMSVEEFIKSKSEVHERSYSEHSKEQYKDEDMKKG